MDVTPILEPLNEAQREAVSAPLGHALVLAGAGSGKTRVLVHRVAWLIAAEGASPHGILAVTFTNKAAAEMRARVESLLELPGRSLWIGTFHGIAHRLLRRHAEAAALPDNFQIIDADDQIRLVKRILRSLDLDEHRWPPRQAAWFINGQKDEGRRSRHIDPGEDLFLATQQRIYAAYETACERGGMVDFAELLLRSHELWLEQPPLLAHYQHRLRHLLVDEFQDTNGIQYAWLRMLAGSSGRMMAVGDDDQSIYGWRGARIENIHRFREDFPDVATIRLEQNYRSSATILHAANTLIGNNSERLGKELWTSGEQGEPIRIYAGYNELDEARFLAEHVRAWIHAGGSPGEIAVLYRSNAQSRVIEEALLRLEIPYRIYGGVRFFERAEIRNALAYMRLIASRDADASFERVVNTPPRGIGEKTLDTLRTLAREREVPLWQAASLAVKGQHLSARASHAVKMFIDFIETLGEVAETRTLSELVVTVLDDSGLYEYHASERGERGQARRENLDELVTACRQFSGETLLPVNETGDDADPQAGWLEQFLDMAALESGEVQAEASAEGVQLMTLHAAKGLEFSLVFLTGVEEGLFPHRMALDEPGRMEEERRLCYVGVTRAMRQLYMTYAETRRLHGSETHNRPSRFLLELPDDALEEVRLGGSVTGPRASRAGELGADDGQQTQAGVRLGARVRHPSFGDGVVVSCEGEGARARVQVSFDDVGSKWLMLGYAKLDALE